MYCENACLGVDCVLEDLKVMNARLNSMVMEQVNGSQELVMMSTFEQECNEYRYKKSLQDRLSEISSWRWVLNDLVKRLEDAIGTLQYEHNALRVVVERVRKEIDIHCRECSRPGAMTPLSDLVEESIMEELQFLRDQKRRFEKMIPDLDKQRVALEKTRDKIVADILDKEQAISIDETNVSEKSYVKDWKKKRKKGLPVNRWEKRCAALKRAGLRSLSNAIVTRHQVRGARIQLSVAAQSYATKVDSALRRRLHANKIKLQDVDWQREEALTDYKCLDEELTMTEQKLLETMEKEQLVVARLANRTLRPGREHIKDDVDKKLLDEHSQLKKFNKDLRSNMDRIKSLQTILVDAITRIDCCAEDLIQVIRLDEERIQSRLGEVENSGSTTAPSDHPQKVYESDALEVIQEENEDDDNDYPFDS